MKNMYQCQKADKLKTLLLIVAWLITLHNNYYVHLVGFQTKEYTAVELMDLYKVRITYFKLSTSGL